MKLKLDENNNVVVKDGMPVYVHEDGKEIPFDANKATVKIAELNSEAKQRALELLAFMGLSDRAHHKPAELSGGEKQKIGPMLRK